MTKPKNPKKPQRKVRRRPDTIAALKAKILTMMKDNPATPYYIICQNVGVPKRTVGLWRTADKAFDDLVKDAQELRVDAIEAEGIRRARDGVEKPLLHKGEPVYRPYTEEEKARIASGEKVERTVWTLQEYSDSLLQFFMKGLRPEVYGDKNKTTLVGNNDGPIDVEFKEVSPRESIASRLAGIAERNRADGVS